MRATDQWYLALVALFSAFLRHENAIPEVSCDPRLFDYRWAILEILMP